MSHWLRQYGGYLLIAAGWMLFSVIIPSAAGPADSIPRDRITAPALGAAANVSAAPLLISSPRTASLSVAPAQPPQPPYPIPEIATAVPLPTDEAPVAPVLPPAGRIIIPRIGLDTRIIDVGVLPNGEMETAAYAAGRLNLSADAGEMGNVVIAGHNDVLGEVFRRLPELQTGDDVVLYRGDMPSRYRVEGRTIVREQGATEAQRRENARWMDPTDEAVTTLISCYPYRVDTHRYIVRARLLD